MSVFIGDEPVVKNDKPESEGGAVESPDDLRDEIEELERQLENLGTEYGKLVSDYNDCCDERMRWSEEKRILEDKIQNLDKKHKDLQANVQNYLVGEYEKKCPEPFHVKRLLYSRQPSNPG